MSNMSDITYTPGAHPGWDRYSFDLQGRTWGLLTVNRSNPSTGEEPFSLLSPKDEDRTFPWPYYNIRRFDGILSAEAAIEIVRIVYLSWDCGVTEGRQQKVNEIRAALA